MKTFFENSKESIITSVGILAVIWASFLIDSITGKYFSSMGISPRDTSTLLGILISPIMHANLNHIISNSLPLLFLSIVFFLKTGGDIVKYIIIATLSGVLLWTFGFQGGIHIGASSLIYGLFAYIVFDGVFHKRIVGIAMAVGILFLYAIPMFLGVIPNDNGVSWDGHLYGFIAGFIVAFSGKK